jgi:hypothetical protein
VILMASSSNARLSAGKNLSSQFITLPSAYANS